jgi:hypothetical protein
MFGKNLSKYIIPCVLQYLLTRNCAPTKINTHYLFISVFVKSEKPLPVYLRVAAAYSSIVITLPEAEAIITEPFKDYRSANDGLQL